jgi:hypothetical protein
MSLFLLPDGARQDATAISPTSSLSVSPFPILSLSLSLSLSQLFPPTLFNVLPPSLPRHAQASTVEAHYGGEGH